jgi:hypothetical protein
MNHILTKDKTQDKLKCSEAGQKEIWDFASEIWCQVAKTKNRWLNTINNM